MSVPGGGDASIVVCAGCAGQRPARPENRAAGWIGPGATGGETMIGRRQFLAAAATTVAMPAYLRRARAQEPEVTAEAASPSRAEGAGAHEDAGAVGER